MENMVAKNSDTTTLPSVDEGRKRVLLIAASILAARKLRRDQPFAASFRFQPNKTALQRDAPSPVHSL
jgi:hypothetical protein